MSGSASTVTGTMSARDFIAKWGPGGPAHDMTERAGAQAHLIDLYRPLALNLQRAGRA